MKLKLRKYLLLVVSVIMIVSVAFITIKFRTNSFSLYNSFGVSLPNNHSILGIDVSHHQGKINWDEVEDMKINGDSIQFVYLKVTEGISFKDSRYQRNRKILNAKPVKVGVYHYFFSGF